MSTKGNNNYDYLFRYIIVGDMGKNKKYKSKHLKKKLK